MVKLGFNELQSFYAFYCKVSLPGDTGNKVYLAFLKKDSKASLFGRMSYWKSTEHPLLDIMSLVYSSFTHLQNRNSNSHLDIPS